MKQFLNLCSSVDEEEKARSCYVDLLRNFHVPSALIDAVSKVESQSRRVRTPSCEQPVLWLKLPFHPVWKTLPKAVARFQLQDMYSDMLHSAYPQLPLIRTCWANRLPVLSDLIAP